MPRTRAVNIVVAVAFAAVAATAAWATPGSAFSTTALVRSTAAVRIDIKTHPHTSTTCKFKASSVNPEDTADGNRIPGMGSSR